jgi:hypothetical protein
MKKTIRLVSVLMVLAMLATSLVSCKILTGSYASTTDFFGTKTTVTYTFKGTEFTVVTETVIGSLTNKTENSGKYEIKKDPENADALIIILTTTTENDDGSTSTTTNQYSFAEGKENGVKYIKIGNTQYDAVK